MFLEKGEILHLVNKKVYKVVNFNKLNDTYYYLLENINNNKYIVVTVKLIDSQIYLKEEKDEEVLKRLTF